MQPAARPALAQLERALFSCVSVTAELDAGDPENGRSLRLLESFLLSAYDEVLRLARKDCRGGQTSGTPPRT
jgi:hypothetical protein